MISRERERRKDVENVKGYLIHELNAMDIIISDTNCTGAVYDCKKAEMGLLLYTVID